MSGTSIQFLPSIIIKRASAEDGELAMPEALKREPACSIGNLLHWQTLWQVEIDMLLLLQMAVDDDSAIDNSRCDL